MSSKDTRIPLAVIGTGNVGGALLRQMAGRSDLRVVAVSNSRQTAVNCVGYGDQELLGVAADGNVSRLKSIHQHDAKMVALHLLPICSADCMIVADCSSGDLGEQHRSWLRLGFSVATANKKPVTGSMEQWRELMSYGRDRYRFEATCGAGLPIISTIQDMLATGDDIRRIGAAASGSLNYILSVGDERAKLSPSRLAKQILRAQELGFAEPDIRDDLSGLDLARKALILARLLGREMELSDIRVESLVPDSWQQLSKDELTEELKRGCGLEPLVEHIRQKLDDFKVRCIAHLASEAIEHTIKVELTGLAPGSLIGSRLRGADNVFTIVSRRYPDTLGITGSGAGAEVTAAGVLSDILRIASTM